MNKVFQTIPIMLLAFALLALSACGGNTEEKSVDDQMENRPTAEQADSASAPGEKLNINTASTEEFLMIPTVGNKMEFEFKEYRPYKSIKQFRKKISKYVDKTQVVEYEKYIFVPIHRNNSDTATVMQIPGLDEAETEELLAARPFESNQTFLDSLSSYINEEELAKAESYLKAE